MTERTPMPAELLRYLDARMQERTDDIIRNVLQVPDYPPLPECPTCGAAPERIVSRIDDPDFFTDGQSILVDFKPCGHGFSVSEAERLHG